MKPTAWACLLTALLLSGFVSEAALARGPRAHFGVYIGPGYWPGYYYSPRYYYPPAYYPPAYYPPVVVAPARPPVYIEQGSLSAAPAPSAEGNWWYYCADARAYYPYVRDCPAGWQRVPPNPPS